MKTVSSLADPLVAATLLRGGVVVARTDTLYGVLARADDEAAVAKAYEIKDRSQHKSPIVLINAINQLYDAPDAELGQLCATKWPGPVSIIIPSLDAPVWLRRDNDSVAYRWPADKQLHDLIAQTGPLIAPSANPEGQPPAMTIDQAMGYFGEAVDVYVDGGEVVDPAPSHLLQISQDGRVERLR